MPVGPDYIIGPGDQFTLTLWGTTEGIYALQVTKEGQVTLPKVGVVSVVGLRFSELERTLKRHLSKYYSNFNLSIAMGGLKTVTLYVVGEVANPGSFSLSSLTTVYGALFAAGGPTKQGTLRAIQVLRSGKVIKTVDLYDFLLKGDRSQDIRLQNEDTVFVPLIGPIVGVAGMVYRPAIYELKGGETIDDVMKTAGGILPIALGGQLQLTRYVANQKKVVLDIRLADPPADSANSTKPVEVFGEKVRNMDTISIRPVYEKVWETVNLSGTVQHPGDFQWRPDLRVKEIIDQGGLLPTSEMRRAEIIRLKKDYSDREIIAVDLAALMNGDERQNILLQPQDQVRVYSVYKQAQKVLVSGEVVRPGNYEIMNGERLSDLLRRVGGVTVEGYVYGAVFKRKNVKESETKSTKSFVAKMQTQILANAASSAATAVNTEEASFSKAELTLNQSLLNNLSALQEKSEGRVAINITGNIDEWAGSKDDLILQDGDSLLIPKKPQEVLIIGEVYSPGAQVFLPDMSVKDYIERTGGATKYADRDQIFIVQANGFAYGADTPNVGNIEKAKLKAGDAIFVPQKTERYATTRTTKDIIDILFKTAVIIATITILF
jgi:protein involved in polysaccharide export with SLBB domain